MAKRQKDGICLIFKKDIAQLAHRHALRTWIIASAKRLKSLFVEAKFTGTLCIRTIHIPNEGNSTIIVNALNFFTVFHNVISVFVEMVNFAMVKVDNFCKNKLIAVYFTLSDGKDAIIVVSKSER